MIASAYFNATDTAKFDQADIDALAACVGKYSKALAEGDKLEKNAVKLADADVALSQAQAKQAKPPGANAAAERDALKPGAQAAEDALRGPGDQAPGGGDPQGCRAVPGLIAAPPRPRDWVPPTDFSAMASASPIRSRNAQRGRCVTVTSCGP